MMRASGRAALTSRNTVRPPRPESNTRMVGRSATTIVGRGLGLRRARISCLCLPTVILRSLQQFLVVDSCLAKGQSSVIRPANLTLPPLVQLALATQLSNLLDKVICLSTIYFKLMQEDVGQRMIARFSVRHHALLLGNRKLIEQGPHTGGSHSSRRPKHALEDRIHVLEMISKVEIGLELGLAQVLAHDGVGRQQRLEIAFAAPGLHGVLLH